MKITDPSFSGTSVLSGSLNVSGSILLNGQALTVSLVPIYGSTSPTVLNSTSSIQTLTVTGENFDGSAIGYVKGNNGTRYDPTTSIRNSDVQLTLNFSGSDRLTSANEPYDIYILNGNGESTFEENVVNVDASPIWQTPAGKIGEVYIGSSLTASFNISATDPDSNDTVSYFITGGALPTGMTFITSSGEISQSGEIVEQISDTPSSSGVNYNVTLSATDSTSITTRTFYITKKWPDGSNENLAVQNPQALRSLGITTDDSYWIYDTANGQTTPKELNVKFNMLDGKDWVEGFRNTHAGPATINHVGVSIPWKGFCMEDPNGNFYYTYFSSYQTFNERSSDNTSTGGNRSGYRVFIGLAGGHGIFNNAVSGPCNWSNNSNAAGAVYDGNCGSWPDGLRMGVGGNPTASIISGTWKTWLWMD